MSENIYQVYQANPITTNASTDLMYFGQSPYGAGNDAAMTYANFKGQFVVSLQGTANEVLVNGTSGSPVTGVPITLSTPQSLSTTSSFQVGTLQLNTNVTGGLLDLNGNLLLGINGVTGAVNHIGLNNAATGNPVSLQAFGSDTNVSFSLITKGTGTFTLQSNATSNQYIFTTGTGGQSVNQFNFANTASTNTFTWPAVSGTVALTSQFTNWTAASSTPITAAVNTGYYITDASQVTITLPVTAAAGSIVSIVGNGAGGWVLSPGAGQTIKIIGSTASTSVTSTSQYDCIEVLCTVANTTWVARSMATTGFTIV